MKRPFEALARPAAKTFAAAQAALRAKKYAPARALFHEVVAAHPDHLAARVQELRSAVLADPAADVRDLWRELVARDVVGYGARLDSAADLEPLRRSPHRPELAKIAAEVKAAYTQGLDRGFFFVARSKPAKPQLYDEKARPVLELFQEAYHYDPATGRVRRLTDTRGRVFGILADRPRKRLLLLLVEAVKDNELDTGTRFAIFDAALLSLDTLAQTAPAAFPANEPAPEVAMCVSAKGTPLWTTKAAYTVDAATRKLVVSSEVCPAHAGVKVATDRGEHLRPAAPGVTVDVGTMALTVDGAPTISRKQYVSRDSIGWSPAKTRLLFADELRPCDMYQRFGESDWPPSARGELMAWDAATKKLSRVAEAFSFFEWEWLDDAHLAHETGTQKSPRVAVYDFSSGTETTIETPAGAGLVAVPTFDCPTPLAEPPDENDPEGE